MLLCVVGLFFIRLDWLTWNLQVMHAYIQDLSGAPIFYVWVPSPGRRLCLPVLKHFFKIPSKKAPTIYFKTCIVIVPSCQYVQLSYNISDKLF